MKHSPNTGEKKPSKKELSAFVDGVIYGSKLKTKPSQQSVHKLSGCKCLAGVPLKYCLGYKKPQHATLDNPCACKCHRNGDEDPCERCEPSQQECFCDCHEGEKIWGKEHSSVESCCNCQTPKSSYIDLEQRFWLMWGLAPPKSLKYKKGIEVLTFIKNWIKQNEKKNRL